MAVSILFHAILILIFLWQRPLVESEFLDGDLGGGGGGNGGPESALISLAGPPEPPMPVIPTPPVQPDPIPTPTPTPIPPPPKDTVKTPPAQTPAPTTANTSAGGAAGAGSAGSGGGSGGGTGGGNGIGNGVGSGSGSGDGTGGGGNSPDGLIPPTATALQMPPTPPKKLHGVTIIVDLEIDATGKVLNVQFKQPSGDSKYDAQLKKSAMEWRFRPARNRQGEAVRSVYPVTYTL